MPDSLLLDGTEINGGSAGMWLMNGFDFGAPAKDTAAVTRMLVDGEVLTGRRASNRTVQLPVLVTGTSRQQVNTRIAALAASLDKQSFTLTWTPTAGQVPAPNLLTANQSSVETDASDWGVGSNLTLARSTAQSLAGAASLRLTSSAAGDMFAYTFVGALTPGRAYTAAASFRASTAGRSVLLRVDWYTASGGSYISSSTGTAVADGTGGWQQATVNGLAPATATVCLLVLYVTGAAGAGEVHYADSISFAQQGTVTAMGAPVVFDCYRGSLTQQWSLLEERDFRAQVVLTFQALPWSRPPQPTAIAAIVSAPVVLNAMDSLTGLTGDATLSAGQTGAVDTGTFVQGTGSVQLTNPYGPVTYSGNNYYDYSTGYVMYATGISATLKETFGAAKDLTNYRTLTWQHLPRDPEVQGGIGATLILYSAAGSSQWTTTTGPTTTWAPITFDTRTAGSGSTGTFDISAVTGYELIMTAGFYKPVGFSGSVHINVDYFAAFPTFSGAANQPASLLRFDGVVGAARTPASFSVVAVTAINALLVSRSPNPPVGFDPVLNAPTSTISASVTADSSAFSGSYYAMSASGNAVVYQRKASTLRGTYTVLARVRVRLTGGITQPAAFTISAAASISGDSAYTQLVTKAVSPVDITTAAWQLVAIGELTLPPREVDGANTTSTVDITISSVAGASSPVDFDEAYLIDLAGDTVMVQLPAGVTYTRFWLDAPDPAGFGADVYAGSAANRTDSVSVSPWVVGQGAFNLDPGGNAILVVMDKSDSGGTVTASYFPRYFGAAP